MRHDRHIRCPTSLVRANIPAKVVVRKVYSNFNNAAANRLEVVEDTTDVALLAIAPPRERSPMRIVLLLRAPRRCNQRSTPM